MSWNKLAPIAKTTGRPMASASIVQTKSGPPKISLILSASLREELGSFDRCDVSAGEGEHFGSLLLEFGPGREAFDCKNFVYGGSRIFVPVPDGVPSGLANTAPCALGEKSVLPPGQVWPEDFVATVVIRLPLTAWAEDLAARTPPRVRVAPPEPVPPPCGSSAGRRGPAGCRRLPEGQGRDLRAPRGRALPAPWRDRDHRRGPQGCERFPGRGRTDAAHPCAGAVKP